MENTSLCQFCDRNERIRKYTVLGKELNIKNYLCSEDGIHYPLRSERAKLLVSVSPIEYCNAYCRFCIAKNTKGHQRIDLKIFEKALRILKDEDVVQSLSITGGEPFYDIELLNHVLAMMFDIFGRNIEVAVNTNGTGLKNIHKIKDLQYVDAIHISRHHYDDKINNSIFGIEMPTKHELKEIVSTISYKDIFVFNCMLLKDYINSTEEAHKFLDFAIDVEVPKVAFITCSPINAYAKKQTIDFFSVLKKDDPSIIFTRGFTDFEICRCKDGVYVSPEGKLIQFYGRSTNTGDCCYCRALVYGSDNCLHVGFSDNILWQGDDMS